MCVYVGVCELVRDGKALTGANHGHFQEHALSLPPLPHTIGLDTHARKHTHTLACASWHKATTSFP